MRNVKAAGGALGVEPELELEPEPEPEPEFDKLCSLAAQWEKNAAIQAAIAANEAAEAAAAKKSRRKMEDLDVALRDRRRASEAHQAQQALILKRDK
eukprot:COSAG06_NODE_50973_length_315_cov_0.703704_1_plen_96_part_01